MLISKYSCNDSEKQITEFENRYSISIPNEYRAFLMKYNGGDTPKTTFKVKKVSSDVVAFFGIGNVRESFEQLMLNEWIGKEILPIARDSFGNYIILGLGEENIGQVFFADHEKGYEFEYLTKSFKEFVKKCKSDVISDASKRSIKEREEILIAKGRGHIITDSLRAAWQKEIDKYANMNQEEVII